MDSFGRGMHDRRAGRTGGNMLTLQAAIADPLPRSAQALIGGVYGSWRFDGLGKATAYGSQDKGGDGTLRR